MREHRKNFRVISLLQMGCGYNQLNVLFVCLDKSFRLFWLLLLSQNRSFYQSTLNTAALPDASRNVSGCALLWPYRDGSLNRSCSNLLPINNHLDLINDDFLLRVAAAAVVVVVVVGVTVGWLVESNFAVSKQSTCNKK